MSDEHPLHYSHVSTPSPPSPQATCCHLKWVYLCVKFLFVINGQ